ncbi:MAG: site-2 protease family protein [Firmicutes bacterium]|nr:site-2 protease family protein [Bacillota bacterium]
MERVQLWRRIRVNPLFLVTLGAYAVAGYGRPMLIAFLAVTLHELSHALVADLYGLTVERLEIWPFGGMARIPGLDSEDPYVETQVAVAGPLSNFFWAAFVWAFDRILPLNPADLHLFVESNLAVGALNLLPVAPLDGGRLMRLYWARQVGYQEAERRVREGGLWLARALMGITVLESLTGRVDLALGIFAGFLYWGALKMPRHAPYWAVRDLAQRLLGFQKRPVWPVDDFAAKADTPVGEVIRLMRPLKYHRVVVLDQSLRSLGILYEEALYRGLAQKGPDCPLGDLLEES